MASDIAPAKIISAPATSVLHAWVTADVRAFIAQEAERRRMHPDQLAAAILSAATNRDMVAFIVDY